MFRKLFIAVVMTAALVVGAPFTYARPGSAVVRSCEGIDSISNLVEPVRTFANGDIKVAHISVEEPASAPDHLLIFVRSKEGGSPDDCFVVSASQSGMGFFDLKVANISASYNEYTGLLLRIPVSVYDGTRGRPGGDIKVLINRRNDNVVTIEGGY